ncbi:Protein SlyX [Tritonibacter mobilis]|jgi:SlyX protein|uniref:SlyX protein n=1 Tax=Tritonibacter mobilis F1926 TaxID=1265309 RepID=A0A1B1A3Z2_9RHOB|nr:MULTISPECIES: SlyX family protein [Tritonibacter]EEW57988.1 conserved domain protein [Ruegeria sp. TrichCH4B]MBW3241327.1 SlyX family protein [Epibacterium sp. DP7N7-1]MCZ4267085.1 SlyX family protein [Rhodobacteraceae bacterium G21628-S1]NKX38222.1 SlyX family protein [Rhodobacteraceae bacterium R_SAG5]NKX73229.1 SlyX family protein [Rhodobacteraceae bacterium R_SAG3]PXW84161.1 SlyX protein [Ruegeria sp. P4]
MQHLEEQIAYLTRTVDELNEIVTSQQSDIDLLKRRVQMLMEREAQREAEGSGGAIFGDERPPHY